MLHSGFPAPTAPIFDDLWELGDYCYADVDDDGALANSGVPDGAVTVDDLLFMLAAFEDGNLQGDLDDDGQPDVGDPDGAVTIEDLLFFLARFEQGC